MNLHDTVNVLKILNTFPFLFSNKMFAFRAGIHKMFVRIQTGKTLISLLLQKQSDLGLTCLSRPFWLATSVPNFRTFTVRIHAGIRKQRLCIISCMSWQISFI